MREENIRCGQSPQAEGCAMNDEDNEQAIDVCSYCFENVHMSMFGIVDEFCSGECKQAWDDWWTSANEVKQ
jgi:hypothetical protein